VKASDVFRSNFAGKVNHRATETALGPWTPAPTSLQQAAPHTAQHSERNTAQREGRKAQRRADRSAPINEYNQYHNRQREVCNVFTKDGRDGAQYLRDVLRQQKKKIRASALSWPERKVLLSHAEAQSVLEVSALKLAILQRRREAFPKDLRAWVTGRADEGDARAAAQLRGWRYTDQRNQRRLDAMLETNELHIGPPPDFDDSTDWAELAQRRLARQEKEQALTNQIAAARIWKIDRKTGDVSYTLNGQVSVIDGGRIVTILNQDEAAVLFGLEMAIQKYGPRIACDGTVEWKRMVTKTAAQRGISVQFTDEEMQHALRLQQRLINPCQRQKERGGR
jgi:hypothetical protein